MNQPLGTLGMSGRTPRMPGESPKQLLIRVYAADSLLPLPVFCRRDLISGRLTVSGRK